MFNRMVKYGDALDRTFAALSDPTRRALLARLAEHSELSVSALAEPFAMSLPAVMKHLDVLSDAGLVTREKTGRTVACRLAPGPMEEAMQWLARYQRFWTEQLDRLAAFVEEDTWQPNPLKPPAQRKPRSQADPPRRRASVSAEGSTPAPRKSTPRGRSRRS
ncbi:transcriptional regulator, ArsR family [Paraburkholderia caballeronis]|uniref:DNA-binding transcriptional regulator, ArsR family n=2 Tax=Paraburkholderia caballeronis TaxID=416943 RepID=A0A1H7U1P6_9BURK|nr:ArsR family transcriptional regulator [Paraburkholderia caballeronis]PXW98460.1 ArsR family transcriptional regulator [Paraburkholderia caballeronis]RAJ95191.1 ArsR family transcriptional regulator [Paraburkholderia caballeronis]SEC51755.1 transcriptional regulator, ArsR family [Paraburkholderia caballeronis]SEL91000.1 DNA-binding transcriptional regulator, ArsR family [Paraburkholderia caballeronis]